MFNVTGRLKPGVPVQQAEANLKTIARQLEQEYPNENKGRNITIVPLAQATINPGFRSNIVAAGGPLMAIVALVLLIACANVANLLLARAAVRQKEIALRLSVRQAVQVFWPAEFQQVVGVAKDSKSLRPWSVLCLAVSSILSIT